MKEFIIKLPSASVESLIAQLEEIELELEDITFDHCRVAADGILLASDCDLATYERRFQHLKYMREILKMTINYVQQNQR